MGGKLDNKRIAILATEGFEYVELKEPLEALEKAGAKSEIVSQKAGKIRGWNHTDWGKALRWILLSIAPTRIIMTRCYCPTG